jgi:TMEM175 potassium channel family protein
MSKARTEAFSDGVIAVAITLLALDLHVPSASSAGSLAHALGEQWPSYAAYVVSFLTIGIIWINHHAMLRRLVAVDHAIVMLNIVLLMTVVVLPFSTALLSEYLKAGEGDHLAAAIYGGSLLLMSLAFIAMNRQVLVAKPHLVDQGISEEQKRWLLRRNALGLTPYALATVAAILSAYVTLAICTLVAVYYALPATTPDSTALDT